jgi:tripartite-type tricarboxylate transporter receptor subunit TctC
MYHRRFATLSMVPLLLLLSMAAPSQGQDYPTRPVRIVVPASPGGSFESPASWHRVSVIAGRSA